MFQGWKVYRISATETFTWKEGIFDMIESERTANGMNGGANMLLYESFAPKPKTLKSEYQGAGKALASSDCIPRDRHSMRM